MQMVCLTPASPPSLGDLFALVWRPSLQEIGRLKETGETGVFDTPE